MTAHGLRSSFRDWRAERTNFPSEVAEMALAHLVGNKVEAAYRRGDLYGKRQQLMDHWAAFCASPATSPLPASSRSRRLRRDRLARNLERLAQRFGGPCRREAERIRLRDDGT